MKDKDYLTFLQNLNRFLTGVSAHLDISAIDDPELRTLCGNLRRVAHREEISAAKGITPLEATGEAIKDYSLEEIRKGFEINEEEFMEELFSRLKSSPNDDKSQS